MKIVEEPKKKVKAKEITKEKAKESAKEPAKKLNIPPSPNKGSSTLKKMASQKALGMSSLKKARQASPAVKKLMASQS